MFSRRTSQMRKNSAFTDDLPESVKVLAEILGKPTRAFTKEDWKTAAITIGAYYDEVVRVPGKSGRPRKTARLSALAHAMPAVRETKRGRPAGVYGKSGVPIGVIDHLIKVLLSDEVRRKWPAEAPRFKIQAARKVLELIGHPPTYAETVLRSVSTFRKKIRK